MYFVVLQKHLCRHASAIDEYFQGQYQQEDAPTIISPVECPSAPGIYYVSEHESASSQLSLLANLQEEHQHMFSLLRKRLVLLNYFADMDSGVCSA
jgi:hypothetical protein